MSTRQMTSITVATLILSLLFTGSSFAQSPAPEKSSLDTPPPDCAVQIKAWENGPYLTRGGETFTYVKQEHDGVEETLYLSTGQVLTREEMRAYESTQKIPVVDQKLLEEAAKAPAGTVLDLMVWLQKRPGSRIARELREQRQPEIDALAAQAREIRRSVLPKESLTPSAEEELRESLRGDSKRLPSEQAEEVRRIQNEIEEIENGLRQEIQEQVQAAVGDEQSRFAEFVSSLRGKVHHRFAMQNALQISLPADELKRLGADERVARIIAVPPGELELDNQQSSLGLNGASGFYPDGEDGGIWDAGVLDSGVQQNHPALERMDFLSVAGANDANGHGTSVAGIIASDDDEFRGMAPGMQRMLVGLCVGGNVMAHADWMVSTAADDPEAINLSCGYGTAIDSDYNAFDQFWDGLIDDNRVLVGKSAGNGGDGAGNTRITHPAPAYNLLAVANVFDQNTVPRNDDVIWPSSSRGPTLGGRKKPDIAAPGQQTMSTNNDWATAADFVNINSTSAAAPHVTGGAILLTDLRSSDDPKATKAVLLNTADAWTDNGTSGNSADDVRVFGSEWNRTYGWGYLDLWETWFNGDDVFVDTVDDGFAPVGPDFKYYKGMMFDTEKATLTWHRHVGYNGINNPNDVEALTDLDLWVYNASTGQALDASLSSIDNVEQVAVSANGEAVLRVDVWGGIDPDVGSQSFALATEENFTAADPPSFSFSASTAVLPILNPQLFSVRVFNNGDVNAFNTNVTIDLPPGVLLVNGVTPQNVGTISPGGNQLASWSLLCALPGIKVIQYSASSWSYGETHTTSGFSVLNCI